MGSWIAMIGSAVIGALVLLSLLRFNADATRDSYLTTMEQMTYENLNSAVEILQYDLNRMGYGFTDFSQDVITYARGDSIIFRMDYDDNGTADLVRYFLGSISTASMTSNPYDRMLLRSVNGGAAQNVLPVRHFHMQFLRLNGDSLSTPVSTSNLKDIRSIVIDLTMESADGYDGTYPRITWRGRVMPPGLVRR